MKNSSKLREEFCQFFKEKNHTIVPSSSLLPSSPNLLFTNAGMNAFLPYFLETIPVPFQPPRVANTQKCLRAGGKHNDLEDVGFDCYHHTFFEMLGNWSFGDYFKKEAIEWAWELLVERWNFPPQRLYATYYLPQDGEQGKEDLEAKEIWTKLFEKAGLNPKKYVLPSPAKDNFWTMGASGPCGPCSEIHMDLTPKGDSGGKLVNQDSPLCIEIWNLVFIQYNSENGKLRPLKNQHIDTGMGLERLVAIIQGTQNFQDFSKPVSNYKSDLFASLIEHLEKLSNYHYEDIYGENKIKENATRIIVDHLRTLTFAIADGISLGNTERNYVLRRILRRAVRAGKQVGISSKSPFLSSFVPLLVKQMGETFPELKKQQKLIEQTIDKEEENFQRTLDKGLEKFEKTAKFCGNEFPAKEAFELYDTFGFPIDLTSLMCKENQLSLDEKIVEKLMAKQKEKARKAHQKSRIQVSHLATKTETAFCGFEKLICEAEITEIHSLSEGHLIITDKTPFYAEMGGQAEDSGMLISSEKSFPVKKVIQADKARGICIENLGEELKIGAKITLKVDEEKRKKIAAHHTATHLLHWALREELGKEIAQKGSFVNENGLRFDFNSKALSKNTLAKIETQVQKKIAENSLISSTNTEYSKIQSREDILQFFGELYGEKIRIIQIGGEEGKLNGYSMELCGGTHLKNTKDLGFFKIKVEKAVSSGIRRIEASCGEASLSYLQKEIQEITQQGKIYKEKYQNLLRENKAENKEILAEKLPQEPKINIHEKRGEKLNQYQKELSNWLEEMKNLILHLEKKKAKKEKQSAKEEAEKLIEKSQLLEKKKFLQIASGNPLIMEECLKKLQASHFEGIGCFYLREKKQIFVGVYSALNNANELLQKLLAPVNGKGGGKQKTAKGVIQASQENLKKLTAQAKKENLKVIES